MSKLKYTQALIVFAVWATAMFYSASCTHIGGTCDTTDDCLTRANYGGKGTECVEGFCKCPDVAGKLGKPCCSDGRYVCPREDFVCRTEVECELRLVASFGCSPPPSACATDEDCPGPPDARCGVGRCKEGRCDLDVRVGEPVDSQLPGDCKANVCSIRGDLIESVDLSDLPYDGNPCTFDECSGGKSFNTAWPDRTPCPDPGNGICVLGRCQECSDAPGINPCPAGLLCYVDVCVPMGCTDMMPNGGETDQDCGGLECRRCESGYACAVSSDCLSGVCTGGVCQAPTHTDGVKNGTETGFDCGYSDGPSKPCKDGEGCRSSVDCQSAVCYDGLCQLPTCTDTVQNGSETEIDCGGSCPPCEP